jgi:hypothetical protein
MNGQDLEVDVVDVDVDVVDVEVESPAGARRSTAAMINDCFRHQHPEAYGHPAVPEPAIPTHLRYGNDQPIATSRISIAEEPMGVSGAQPLTD